jgi:nucleotide-binding universal stress UspA family protein
MKINKILLSLDLSRVDGSLVAYTLFFLSKLDGQKHLTLFHNIRYDVLDESLGVEESDIKGLKETITENIRHRHGQVLQESGLTYDILVQDHRSTTAALIHAKDELQADLLVMGLKTPVQGAGIVPQNFLSMDREGTPLLMVPEQSPMQIRHIFSPIDLSPVTEAQVRVSEKLALKFEAEKSCLYVYKLPMLYFPYIETEEEILEKRLKKKADKKITSFLENSDWSNTEDWDIQVKKGVNVAKVIVNHIHRNPVDLVIMGRIGKTNLLGSRLGGVTKRVLSGGLKKPILLI